MTLAANEPLECPRCHSPRVVLDDGCPGCGYESHVVASPYVGTSFAVRYGTSPESSGAGHRALDGSGIRRGKRVVLVVAGIALAINTAIVLAVAHQGDAGAMHAATPTPWLPPVAAPALQPVPTRVSVPTTAPSVAATKKASGPLGETPPPSAR